MVDLDQLDPATRLAIDVIRRWRAGEGVQLQHKTLKRYEPTPNRCHDNVREWVAKYPELKHVYGFLLFDNRPFSDGMIVIAHSVVSAPDGSLNDITPRDDVGREAFLPHVGTPKEFELIAAVEPFSVKVSYALLDQHLRR